MTVPTDDVLKLMTTPVVQHPDTRRKPADPMEI